MALNGVGGLTDLIQKETIDRCDDAVLAVKSAMEEGIVSGAGKALWEINIPLKEGKPKEYAIALDIDITFSGVSSCLQTINFN